MWRKRVSLAFILMVSLSIIMSLGNSASAWTDDELTSVSGTAPTIDGLKDDSWSTSNISYDDFSGRRITLYTKYSGSFLYFLVEVKFDASADEETISIYIADSADADTYLDKKSITMTNATDKGNETSTFMDYYLNESVYYEDEDQEDSSFDGAAQYTETSGSTNRFYEFAIQRTPTNTSEDNTLSISQQYAIKVSFTDTDTAEIQTDPLIIQIGEGVDAGDDTIGEYNFDMELYIRITMVIILVIVGIYGIGVLRAFSSRDKIETTTEEEPKNA